MGAFAYKLGREDGSPADPPTYRTVVPYLERRMRRSRRLQARKRWLEHATRRMLPLCSA
jgi:hypothetical protein